MSKIDVLEELYYGRITEDVADQLLGDALDNNTGEPPEPHRSLGITDIEYRAYMDVASLQQLAIWRYEGWPEVCYMCGEPLRLESEKGWIVKVDQGKYVIVHTRHFGSYVNALFQPLPPKN
jgi:hypothetical protein